MKQVAVIILNWNGAELLRRYLPTVIAGTDAAIADVIVADNGSTDKSLQVLEQEFPDVKVLKFEKNYGFAQGYNLAIGQTMYPYTVLLNSDVRTPQGWLTPLLDYMEAHPGVGAVMPKLLQDREDDKQMFEYAGAAGGYIDCHGYPYCRGRIFEYVEDDHGQYDDGPKSVFWASGACLMVRSDLYRAVGGLDKDFFAHMEEIDLCWRLQLAGQTVTVVPESFVYHVGGGTLPNESPFKLRLNYRNNLLLLENNLAKTFRAQGYSVEGALGKARRRILVRMLLDGASALTYLLSKKWPSYKAVVAAHAEYWKLRRKPSPDEVASQQKEVDIHGWYPKWMVPRALSGKPVKLT